MRKNFLGRGLVEQLIDKIRQCLLFFLLVLTHLCFLSVSSAQHDILKIPKLVVKNFCLQILPSIKKCQTINLGSQRVLSCQELQLLSQKPGKNHQKYCHSIKKKHIQTYPSMILELLNYYNTFFCFILVLHLLKESNY